MKNETKELILNLIKKYPTTKEAQEEFSKQTGLSRWTFFNYKRKL
jgi:hypothetical protein